MIGSVKGIIPPANGSRIRPVLPVGCETSWRMACQRPLRRTKFRSCGTSSRPTWKIRTCATGWLKQYLPLVKYNGERIWARLPEGVELDDLVSAGVFGLMDAIDAFDLSRGVKFETYCVPRIRGAMLDELRTMDWVPRLVRSKASKLNEALQDARSQARPPAHRSRNGRAHADFGARTREDDARRQRRRISSA